MKLLSYQLTGARFLAARLHAFLADEMGLGKTAQAIHACDLVHASRVLVICPSSVCQNWIREFEAFSTIDRNATVLNSKKLDVIDGVNVVSFDTAARHKSAIAVNFDALIVDEAHYLKNRTARRTKAIYGFRQTKGLAHQAKRLWLLSGTPAPNNISEMWPHLKHAGVVADKYWDFVFKYCTGFESTYGWQITGHKNVDEIKKVLSGYLLRRKAEVVMTDLPDLKFEFVEVDKGDVDIHAGFLSAVIKDGEDGVRNQISQVERDIAAALDGVDGGEKQIAVLEAHATNAAMLRKYIALAKVPKILETLGGELGSGRLKKVVVFAHHRDVIVALREGLRKWGPVTLWGATPDVKRQNMVDKFRWNDNCQVFIGQIQSAGVGITLTSAHEVVLAELSYRPDENAQAIKRCHRLTQTENVRVRIFSLKDSIDGRIQQILLRKVRELKKVF